MDSDAIARWEPGEALSRAVSDLERSRDFYSTILGLTPNVTCERWQGYALGNNSRFGFASGVTVRELSKKCQPAQWLVLFWCR